MENALGKESIRNCLTPEWARNLALNSRSTLARVCD